MPGVRPVAADPEISRPATAHLVRKAGKRRECPCRLANGGAEAFGRLLQGVVQQPAYWTRASLVEFAKERLHAAGSAASLEMLVNLGG